MPADCEQILKEIKEKFPAKFAPESQIFANIHRGDRIFIGTGCGQPQYLVRALVNYVHDHPKAFFDTEVFHVWTLGVAPYTDEQFKYNFRHNSFFVGNNTRTAVNEGLADYTPIFLSAVPELFRRKAIRLDVALIQTSMPDIHGYLSLGVSVDIVKAAVENAGSVIIQINRNMPRTHGDAYIHISDVDYAIHYDEPLLVYDVHADDEVAQRIGKFVARLVEDGDTIQVGYGSIPDAIMDNLLDKKDLGVHTELIGDGIVKLIKAGVINNARKSLDRGVSVASFCMGSAETYEFLNDNPMVKFRAIDYTNSPLIIAQHHNMCAINSTLEIDLTGQTSAESLGNTFYSGIGGQADFMRGAIMAPHGKTILAIQSTAEHGKVSRIVPHLMEGAGVTLNRGDVHYVVSEYGIAYLHGKNVRERAMELISIAHPKFRPWLIQEAKKRNLIYKDQAFIPGKRGEYPENIETYRTTRSNLEVFIRPVRISDEPLLKDLFYDLSDDSLYRRFISSRKDMPHERLQEFVVIDYTREMVLLALVKDGDVDVAAGMGQFSIDQLSHTAEVAFAVKDEYQNRGIGSQLLDYLIFLARRQGLLGLSAEVLARNKPMLHLFEKRGFIVQRGEIDGGDQLYELKLALKGAT